MKPKPWSPPFSPAKIVTLDVSADKSAPDRTRPQQPLEAFPIEDLRVMGIIMAGSVPYALIQTPPPNKPKHVRVGEYMGRSFGKITAITPRPSPWLRPSRMQTAHGCRRNGS
jgi:type IV pilus assembly protein PilP